MALLSNCTPCAVDWPSVRFPSCGVTGQNCSGVKIDCPSAPVSGESVGLLRKSVMIELTYDPFGRGNVVPPTMIATDEFVGTISDGMLVGAVVISFCAKNEDNGDSTSLIASRSACSAACSVPVYAPKAAPNSCVNR